MTICVTDGESIEIGLWGWRTLKNESEDAPFVAKEGVDIDSDVGKIHQRLLLKP